MSVSTVTEPSPLSSLKDVAPSQVDIESRMMQINKESLEQVNLRMSDQLDALDRRNQQAIALRQVTADATAVSVKFKSTDDTTVNYPEKSPKSGDPLDPAVQKLADDMKEAQMPGFTDLVKDGQIKKGDLDQLLAKLNGMMDTATTTQQSDMLLLQSTSSKRDQLFDLMSTFTKKFQDSRSSIIRNM